MVLTIFFFLLIYSNIIKLYLKYTTSTNILVKLNLWSFLNLKYYLFRSTSFLYYFLTNLSKFKIKFLKINNYTNFNFLIFFFFFLVSFILLCLIVF